MNGEKSTIRTELLEKSPVKLMIKLCIPAIVGMLVIGLYSLIDAVFVGQLLGIYALGAISVAYPFTLINNGVATLIGIGSASVLSRAIGKKDMQTVDKIMGNLLAAVLLLSLAVTVIGVTFTRGILTVSGAEGQILELSVRYLRIVFIGSFFVNFAQSANMVMRGEGLMKTAMMIMAAGAIINIVLDPVLIMTFRDSGYGIEGAAAATVLAQIVQAGITIFYYLKKSRTVQFHRIRFEIAILPEIFSVGFSAMLMQVMYLIQQTVFYNVASRYGGDVQIIFIGAAMRVSAFSFIPLWGMSQGFQPVVGTNYGAGEYERVKKVTNIFFAGSTMLALCFWIPIQLFPEAILSLFIKDAELAAQGVWNFRLMFSIFPVLGIMIMSITFFQALGKGKKASVLVLLRQIALFIPLVMILPKFFNVQGIWAASPLTDGMVLILSVGMVLAEYRKMRELQ